ncbi:carbohydrate kinase [Alkalinema sp. FACHB-956]|uniref:carbohydrate kinase family protein n=1 Tax=Alkalinema sp. FACHB-956 TaxID=2692768 RepID=UPI001687EC1E|nr:carbohydrate kinase [Alkalinema sp. FACHB-956]MBD2327170.1 carbohydrate kinase [Alkalinema sp. FACHB-956]
MASVCCLGEILLDCIADQAGLPLDRVESWTSYPGGAPANVACALVKLGTPAGFIGCVGQDDAGSLLVQLLDSIGVDTTAVQRHATAPTRSVMVVRSQSGDRQFAAFRDNIDTSTFADAQLNATAIPLDWLTTADYLVTGTLGLAEPNSAAAIIHAVEAMQQANRRIFVDVNWRPVFWKDDSFAPTLIVDLIDRADYLKLTDEEADWLLQTQDLQVIADRFPNLQAILMTAGEKGCTYWIRGHAGQVPAFAIEVMDTTGAGDSFTAGFLHQLCQLGDAVLDNAEIAHQMVVYASAVGALTTTRAGAIAAQPTAAEVDAFLHLTERMNGHGTGD